MTGRHSMMMGGVICRQALQVFGMGLKVQDGVSNLREARELRGKGLGKGPGGVLGHARRRDPNSIAPHGPLYA